MDKAKKERLTAAGIDVDGALERFMNNEALLERFLRKFPADPNYETLTAAFAAGDWEEALTASHTLKGMCGNLSLTALFSLLSRQVELLQKELLSTAQRVNLFEKVKIPEAKENIRVIGIYLGDQQTSAVVRGKIAKKKLQEVSR